MKKAGIKTQTELTNKMNECDKDMGIKHYVQHVNNTLRGIQVDSTEIKAMTRVLGGDDSLITQDILEDHRGYKKDNKKNIGKKLSEAYYKQEVEKDGSNKVGKKQGDS